MLVEDYNADITVLDAWNLTPLHTCNDPEVARYLIKKGLKVDECENAPGLTPLHLFVHRGEENRDMRVFDVFIEEEADVNARNKFKNRTPLHLCGTDDLELAKKLVESGADPELKDCDGNVPEIFCINDEFYQWYEARKSSV